MHDPYRTIKTVDCFTVLEFSRTFLCLPSTSVVAIQWLIHVQFFATPWTAACQGFLSFTISQSLLKLMSIVSVMPCNHLMLCRPFLLLPSIFPSIRVFSNGLALCIRWPNIGASASVLPALHGKWLSFPASVLLRVQVSIWNSKITFLLKKGCSLIHRLKNPGVL